MIELRGAIELRDDRRQFDPETPFIGASSHLLDRCAPPVPPTRHEPGDWLDNEQPIAASHAFQQDSHEPVTGRVGKLVQGKSCDDRRRSFGQRDRGHVAFHGSGRQPKPAIGPRRFAERPGVTVDADDAGSMVAGGCPGRPGRPRSATKINKGRRLVRSAQRAGQRLNDGAHQQEMQRPVKEREGRAFSGTVQRSTLAEPLPALDVCGRKRAQPRRQLGKGQIRQVTLLDFKKPAFESIVP